MLSIRNTFLCHRLNVSKYTSSVQVLYFLFYKTIPFKHIYQIPILDNYHRLAVEFDGWLGRNKDEKLDGGGGEMTYENF